MCANITVNMPKSNPAATHVEENNRNKLTPVIASGLTIVKLEANNTDLL
jgi:hypothetical protein